MPRSTWCQVNVTFRDWERAETTALVRLVPLLRAAEDEGAVTAWFIVRKHPCWRVRYMPSPAGQDRIGQSLDELIAEGCISGWTKSVYEPEVHAFGGARAMESAHRFFHRDSHHLFNFLRSNGGRHRRETSLMMCSLMLRSAGLDWYEQGDVWARVAAHRTPPVGTARDSNDKLHAAVLRFLTVDPQYAMQAGNSLADTADWAAAYTDTARDVAHLADTGQLHRGLRDVLAHHVIFAWNRLGLPYQTQATLTAAAKTVIFGPDPTERSTADRVETP